MAEGEEDSAEDREDDQEKADGPQDEDEEKDEETDEINGEKKDEEIDEKKEEETDEKGKKDEKTDEKKDVKKGKKKGKKKVGEKKDKAAKTERPEKLSKTGVIPVPTEDAETIEKIDKQRGGTLEKCKELCANIDAVIDGSPRKISKTERENEEAYNIMRMGISWDFPLSHSHVPEKTRADTDNYSQLHMQILERRPTQDFLRRGSIKTTGLLHFAW